MLSRVSLPIFAHIRAPFILNNCSFPDCSRLRGKRTTRPKAVRTTTTQPWAPRSGSSPRAMLELRSCALLFSNSKYPFVSRFGALTRDGERTLAFIFLPQRGVSVRRGFPRVLRLSGTASLPNGGRAERIAGRSANGMEVCMGCACYVKYWLAVKA